MPLDRGFNHKAKAFEQSLVISTSALWLLQSSINTRLLPIVERRGAAWSLCDHGPQARRCKPKGVEDGRGRRKRTCYYTSESRFANSLYPYRWAYFTIGFIDRSVGYGSPPPIYPSNQQFIRVLTVSARYCVIGST